MLSIARARCATCARSAVLGPSSPVTWSRSLTASRRLLDSSSGPQSDSELLSLLKTRLKEAMKAKDSSTSATLRGLLSDFQYAEKNVLISGGKANAPSLVSVLQKAVASRQEAAQQYRTAKADDRATKEEDQMRLIQSFLPKEMSADEIKQAIQAVMDKLSLEPSDRKTLSTVIKEMESLYGKAKAPGKIVSTIVKQLIGGGGSK